MFETLSDKNVISKQSFRSLPTFGSCYLVQKICQHVLQQNTILLPLNLEHKLIMVVWKISWQKCSSKLSFRYLEVAISFKMNQDGTCCASSAHRKVRVPTNAILSRNLVLSRFTCFLKCHHRAFYESHPALGVFSTTVNLLLKGFQQKSACFRKGFGELAFDELS